MNFKTAKPWQPELLDKRPREIMTRSSREFFAVLARERSGEFKVQAVDSLATSSGKDNAAWRFEVYYERGEQTK